MYKEFSPDLKKSANTFSFMKEVATADPSEESVHQSQEKLLSKKNGNAKKKLQYTDAEVKKVKKKEPPGHCSACGVNLSRKSDEGRHWTNSCKMNPDRVVKKSKS